MDKATLVKRLKEAFVEKRNAGLLVDAIGLVPAYHGAVDDCYTLGVSAPSLKDIHVYAKMGAIIDILFECLTSEERAFIDRVRVFNNVEELESAKENEFEEYPYEGYDSYARAPKAELYEVA
ncbi:hypothetical protein MUK70_02855 [Dyadobacter chenwenxiniae]|uniref:Uncharacterized protein n=1 Tax=Dyadobacter chenwenxiniae TaxID=2906456 RepID=A0A9X1PJN8_9BACT|nr:hypothetical protein [Dyadobacter chenwenxiniae]MCF0062310.1 hypothetical protein [Dyadobacter chenwenxiniae]UON83934.1 hypothetical protein MUK70_02855 [Dyadobacter chenwenxiniae]